MNKKFLRENLVLVMGVTLSVLLMVLFALASAIPRFLVDPPHYDFLFVYNDSSGQYGYRFTLEQGILHAKFRGEEDKNYPQPKLYRFDVSERKLREISYSTPARQDEWVPVVISDAEGMTLDSSAVSPDGYAFEFENRKYGSWLLFYGGWHRHVVISKKGNRIKISEHNDNCYVCNAKFLGWIISE